MTAEFTAVVLRKKKCPECDEFNCGIFERIDHGCLFEVHVGDYSTLNVARLAAMGAAKAKGRGSHAGVCTGDWHVETAANGIVDAGAIDRTLFPKFSRTRPN